MSYPLFFHSLSPSALAVCTHPTCGPFWDSTNTEHRGAEQRRHINCAGKANAREGKTWVEEGARRVWVLTPLTGVAGVWGGVAWGWRPEADGEESPRSYGNLFPVWLWQAVTDRVCRWAVRLLCSVKDAPCSFLSPNCPGRLEIRRKKFTSDFCKTRQLYPPFQGGFSPPFWKCFLSLDVHGLRAGRKPEEITSSRAVKPSVHSHLLALSRFVILRRFSFGK